jgi:hypothetical protein
MRQFVIHPKNRGSGFPLTATALAYLLADKFHNDIFTGVMIAGVALLWLVCFYSFHVQQFVDISDLLHREVLKDEKDD